MKLLTSHGLDYEMQGASEHEFCHDKKRIGKGLVPAGIVELFENPSWQWDSSLKLDGLHLGLQLAKKKKCV